MNRRAFLRTLAAAPALVIAAHRETIAAPAPQSRQLYLDGASHVVYMGERGSELTNLPRGASSISMKQASWGGVAKHKLCRYADHTPPGMITDVQVTEIVTTRLGSPWPETATINPPTGEP